MHEFSPKQPRIVGSENRTQYGEGWPLSADIRRYNTLKYAVPQRDTWREIAEVAVHSGAKRILDVGTSNGYIIRQMLDLGYDGEIVGIDIEDSYLPVVSEIISKDFPNANVKLLGGDAQNLSLDMFGGEPFDAAIGAHMHYHALKPGNINKSLNHLVVDGGLIVQATKDVDHQEESWILANQAAQHIKARPIHPFYWHYPVAAMRKGLTDTKRFKIISEELQFCDSYIPDTEEGWSDTKLTVLTLTSLMQDAESGLPVSISDVDDFLESDQCREYIFKNEARRNGGFFKGKVRIAYWVCENNNPAFRY